MFVSVDTTESEGYPTITTPTGWNLIYRSVDDNQDEIAVYDRVLTGSETSSYAVTLSTTAGRLRMVSDHQGIFRGEHCDSH